MLTIGSTYYNNPEYLLRFVERNLPYVQELIIVDDGSTDVITNHIQPSKKIRLFRTLKDYGFNSHGCRNLIMKKTTYDWVILMDLDREFIWPEVAYDQIKRIKLNNNIRYRFVAHKDAMRPEIEAHGSVNDYMIHRQHFFSAGGYDEEIIGQRWGDREFFKQLLNFGNEEILYGVDIVLTRPPSLCIGTTSPYDIRTEPDHVDLIYKRIEQPDPYKPILTFEWEEIL